MVRKRDFRCRHAYLLKSVLIQEGEVIQRAQSGKDHKR